MKIILANQYKNESSRIEEWIRYHKEIGIVDFVLVDDHSVDNSKDIAKSINDINIEILENEQAELSFNGGINTEKYRGSTQLAKTICNNFIRIHEYCYAKYGEEIIIGFFDIDEFIFSEKELDIPKTINDFIKDEPVISLYSLEVNSDKFEVGSEWITLQTTNSMSMENKLKSTRDTVIKSFQNLSFKNKIDFFTPCFNFNNFYNYGAIIHNGGINDETKKPHYSDLAFLHYRKPIYDPTKNIKLCDKKK